MIRLGVIYFTDTNKIDASIYVYGAVSLTALATYCQTLRQFTAAKITKISWSADGEVQYNRTLAYGQRKTYLFNATPQHQTVNLAGATGDAYSANYYARLLFRTHDTKHPRRTSIPAPLKQIFTTCLVNDLVGFELASAFALLVNQTLAFHSGDLSNPKQIHPMPQ